MMEPDNLIDAVLQRYAAAVHAKDVEAFAALYAADVRVFDLWGEWACEGIAAWRAMAESWFGSLGDERVVVTFDSVRTMVAGDMALVHGFVTYQGVARDGTPLRAMHNRMTQGLRRRDGAWKVVHEHTSSPVDFATGKAMLSR